MIRPRRTLPPAPRGLPATDPGEPTEAEITGRRRIPGPVDSVRSTAGSERSSQVRARDRATLRTIKELAEKEGNLAGGGPPTRRQLRLLQLAAETAPATSANTDCPRVSADPGHARWFPSPVESPAPRPAQRVPRARRTRRRASTRPDAPAGHGAGPGQGHPRA